MTSKKLPLLNEVKGAVKDIDHIVKSLRLHRIRRFFHQRYFEEETRAAEFAEKIEPQPRLETVSEHSWHLADTVILIAPSFPEVNLDRAVQLAVVHDKMEMYIGDIDPIGRDGSGDKSHAFNSNAKEKKKIKELEALEKYLASLPKLTSLYQRSLYEEVICCKSIEARFVKSLDKLVALVFILVKKAGVYSDTHLELLNKLTERNSHYYEPLRTHHQMLFQKIISSAARNRGQNSKKIFSLISKKQLGLF
jgi:putative hydrolase of HD superfamily